MNIAMDFHNKLLKRREIIVKKQYVSNPGFETVMKDVAEHFKASPDCIVIRSIRGTFGSNVFSIEARVYDSVDALQMTEPKPKVKKVEAGK